MLKGIVGRCRFKFIFLGLLLSFFIIFIYSGTLKYGYVNWDDSLYASETPQPAGFSFAALKKTFASSHMSLYHPLTMLSFSAENKFFGHNPFVRRLDNLILHTANAALVFLLFILLGAGTVPAFWTGLLWAVNPVQAESVAWVAERKNLLFAFFYLSSLIFYLRYIKKNKLADYFAALFIFSLSLFSKATAISLPFTLILIDIFNGRPASKRSVYEKTPFIFLSCIFAALAVAIQSDAATASFRAYPQSSFIFYLKEFFMPFGLSAFYPYNEMAARFAGAAIRSTLWVTVIFAALVCLFKKEKNIVFGFMFFVINMFPFLFLVPAGDIMTADRYLYISCAGLAFIPAFFLCGMSGRYPRYRAVFISILALIALVWAFQARTQARTWQSGKTLWTSVLERFPGNETANLNMAMACFQEGSADCFVEYLNRTLKINPSNAEALYSLAIVYATTGKIVLAENLFKRSITLSPFDTKPVLNLSVLYLKTRRYALAEDTLKLALTISPADPEALRTLSWLYADTGKCSIARSQYSAYIKAESAPDLILEKKLDECK